MMSEPKDNQQSHQLVRVREIFLKRETISGMTEKSPLSMDENTTPSESEPSSVTG